MSIKTSRTVLLLTPDLRGNVGGVANYYNVLRLDELTPVEYFYVNSAIPEPPLRRLRRLASNYARFALRMLKRDYALIHFNPSLNSNSFIRDGIFLLLARLNAAPRLVFFRGWDDRFSASIERNRLLGAFFRLTYGSCSNFVVLGKRFAARLETLGIREARVWIETTVADARPCAQLHESNSEVEDALAIAAGEASPAGATSLPTVRGHGADYRIGEPFVAGAAKGITGRSSLNVLFMSRLLISKGALIAIDAVHLYLESRTADLPSLRLQVAGAGADEAAIRRYVSERKFQFVEFLGHVNGAAKWRAFEEADIFLFPTCYPEGLSNAVLEAMLHGLPVIARPEGALDEVVANGINGYVTDSKEPAAFAALLEALARDPALYRRISARNLEDAATRFSREKVVARLLEIYDHVGTSSA